MGVLLENGSPGRIWHAAKSSRRFDFRTCIVSHRGVVSKRIFIVFSVDNAAAAHYIRPLGSCWHLFVWEGIGALIFVTVPAGR